MSVFSSSLYHTRIWHRRRRPKGHRLRYSAFYLLLDLDELDTLHRRLKWFSYNSFNLFSLYDRDHGAGSDEPLRDWVEHHLDRARIDLDGGRIRMLCLPRILGYVFNPITVYYCEHRDGRLAAVLYEVTNTFGQRHTYLFETAGEAGDLLRHRCDKRFYVSPFIDVSGRYEFSMRPPGDSLQLHIRQADESGAILDAGVSGEREPLTDRRLLRCLVRYPLLTLKVIAGIHWEALQLWLKGVRTVARPGPPAEPVTIVTRPHR